MGQLNNGNPIRCDCGKLVAKERDGRIYVFCRACKREIEVARKSPEVREPRGR